MESENAAAVNIAAENVEEVGLPCMSSTTIGIIKIGIYGQDHIMQDRLRINGASNLNRDFFSMGVCLFFNFFS